MGGLEAGAVKSDIERAFSLAVRFHERREDVQACIKLEAERRRVTAFLAQVEAKDRLLMEALRACQVAAEAKDDKEAARAKRMARDVLSQYGEPGGMYSL